MVDFKGGRLPNDPNKPRLKFSAFAEPAPLGVVAPRADYLSRVSSWPMYLNDRYGDCTCAAAGHMIEVWTTYGLGRVSVISDQDVLKAYSDVTGFNPSTGANDKGAVMQDVLNYWRKEGIGGHKILAFAEVNIQNTDEARRAVELFGDIYLGINFPAFAMDQFNAGLPWDVSDKNTHIEGGHAINGAWYDVDQNLWKVVTWGRVQPMTQAFWDRYVDEAWVAVTQEWFDNAGKSPEGIDAYALGEQFTALTGEPNPFPKTPAPVSDVDDVFATDAQRWLDEGHYFYKGFQQKMRKWLASRLT